MKKFLTILLILSFLIPQEPCDGECYSDEEVQNIEAYITKLEHETKYDSLVVKNLNEQLQLYFQQTEIDSQIIANYIEQLQLKDDLIKEIKPKWYENKWLWFTIGVLTTAGSIKIAGELVD